MKSRIIGITLSLLLPVYCLSQTICTDYSPKLSAATAERIQQYESKTTRGISDKELLFAYVRLKPETDIDIMNKKYGVRINVGVNGIYTAIIPIEQLNAFTQDSSVLNVDAGKEVRTMMDSVRIYTNVEQAFAGKGLPHSFQGEGVIVGIIDSGFDFTHPNFKDETGNCRIQCVWDQNNLFATPNSSYGYGVVYSTPEQIAAVKHDMSGNTHGTHVAGIATGSYNNLYRGIAPKAEIVLVSVNGTEQGIVDGIDFLLHYADEAKRPLAINLSMGTVLGFKDGTDNFSILTDNLMRDKKGKILAIAAGNEGHRKSTINGTFDGTVSEVKTFLVPPSYNRDNLFIQGTAGHVYQVTVSLKDTLAKTSLFSETFTTGEEWSKSYEQFGSGESNNSRFFISSSLNPINQNPFFNISLTYVKPENEAWEISVSSEQGKYMLNSDYGSFTSANKKGYTEGNTDYTIACTATGYESIAVGAYVTKENYQSILGTKHRSEWSKEVLYPLSGKGPTYDGRIKPDITAPGATVVSSFNSYAASYSVSPEEKVLEMTDNTSGRKYAWGIANGTSMATPVVTGTLALWLEADPTLTTEKVKDIMLHTAINDRHTGDIPNAKYGVGKLDATAGLHEILKGTSSLENPSSEFRYIYEKGNGIIRFFSDSSVEEVYLYSASGELLNILKYPGKEFHLDIKPNSLYLIRICTKNSSRTLKLASY
ncbi:S8 family serine peptidase [Bacteroides sp.]